jgi:hypothetical protein
MKQPITIDDLKSEILKSSQHYYNKEQVLAMLNKLPQTNKGVQASLFEV